MSLVRGYLDAAAASAKRDVAIFLSYRTRLVSQMLTMLGMMTMFFYVSKLVRPGAVGPNGRYFAFVVVGIVTLAILQAAMNLSQMVRMELLAGTFERILLSPLGPLGGVVSLAIFPVCYSIATAGVMLVVAKVMFGFPVLVWGIPAALAVAGLAAVAFVGIGLLFVAGLLAFKSGMGASWVLGAMSLAGGVYFPLRLLPGWMSWVSQVQPFTPALELLRHLLLGMPSTESVWADIGRLAGFGFALVPLSAAVLWQAVKLSRRRGTLMEY